MNGPPRGALRCTDDLLPNHGETSVMSYFRLTRVAAALVPFAPFLMAGCASIPSADTARPSETAAIAAAAAHAATSDATSARNGRSWNCGAEGSTNDRRILDLRARQQRNLFTTLMLSVGVPMISGGDELSRTQRGNNNAYCQDNEISWLDWTLTPEHQEFLDFTRRVIRIWKDHPVLRRRKFFQGRRIRGAEVQDIAWLDPTGAEMTDDMWNSPDVRVLGVRLNGDAIQEINERGERIVDDTFLVMFNAGPTRRHS